jgi:hypothetical protein
MSERSSKRFRADDAPVTPEIVSEPLQPLLSVSMDFGGLNAIEIFTIAMKYVNIIVFSDEFRRTMSDLMPTDFLLDNEAFDFVLKSKFVFLPNLVTKQISAYAWTDPTIKADDGSFIIYFNSQLLVNYSMLGNGADKVLFLVVKIVHEMAHIFNYHCCSYFRANPTDRNPEKKIDQKFKIRKPNKQVTITEKEITYDDFGEMMEIKLFGSLIESSTTSEHYMQTDRVVAYPSTATFFGNVVDSERTLSRFESKRFNLVLGAEYESQTRPSVKGISTNLPGIRLSVPGEIDEESSEVSLPLGVRI